MSPWEYRLNPFLSGKFHSTHTYSLARLQTFIYVSIGICFRESMCFFFFSSQILPLFLHVLDAVNILVLSSGGWAVCSLSKTENAFIDFTLEYRGGIKSSVALLLVLRAFLFPINSQYDIVEIKILTYPGLALIRNRRGDYLSKGDL